MQISIILLGGEMEILNTIFNDFLIVIKIVLQTVLHNDHYLNFWLKLHPQYYLHERYSISLTDIPMDSTMDLNNISIKVPL